MPILQAHLVLETSPLLQAHLALEKTQSSVVGSIRL
jgi:hypothetical protein